VSNTETDIRSEIQKSLNKIPSLRIFRNNTGVAKSANGKPLRYGLKVGSSDLIGWKSITVSQEMIGKKVAVFVAIEIKKPGAKSNKFHLEDQKDFVDDVLASGGIAGFADSLNKSLELLNID
jgi:hypothetical protein